MKLAILAIETPTTNQNIFPTSQQKYKIFSAFGEKL